MFELNVEIFKKLREGLPNPFVFGVGQVKHLNQKLL
jgi:hypothetical protein